MKAAIINRFGGPEVFEYTDVADPTPREGYTIVKVLACGINRYDLFLRMGGIQKPTPLPHVMGADIAGEIVDVCGDALGFSPGQRVIVAPGFPLDPADWDASPETLSPSYTVTGTTEWGGYAEYVQVPTRFLLADRTGLPAEQVAAVPLVLVTAVHAVQTLGKIKTGDRVLVQAGASGSGSMCIQLARHLGGRVATTVGSDAKIKFARACGAELVINHRQEDFAERVAAWTVEPGAGVSGVDVVIDNVGGGVFAKNLACLKPGGALVNFGLVGGVKDTLNFAGLIFNQHRILGSMMGTLEELRQGLRLIESGHLRPNLDRTFPLSQAAAAHAYIDSRQVQGKAVLVPRTD
jgi:NADPH2:quinone reductase